MWLFHKLSHVSFTRQFLMKLALVAVCICLLIVGEGIANAFVYRYQAHVDAVRFDLASNTDNLLNAMIDQETGIRGYVATGQAVFLEPFYQGRTHYLSSLFALEKFLRAEQLQSILPFLYQTRDTAELWYSSCKIR